MLELHSWAVFECMFVLLIILRSNMLSRLFILTAPALGREAVEACAAS